ncbi:homoserine O-acetyltransferase [Apiospora arundinis]
MASSAPATTSHEKLISVLPSKGMRYGASALTDDDSDDIILAALKAALNSNSAEFKSEVDINLAELFKNASTQPILSTLMEGNDGLEFLTKLQAQTIWAAYMNETAFGFMFQGLVKAKKKWEEEAGVTFTFFKSDYSKTSTEIANFLKIVGKVQWEGLDAEIELLKLV